MPCDTTQVPSSFSGERHAIISIWRTNKRWHCDLGYYAEDETAKVRLETLDHNVQYWAESLIPAVSYIISGGRTYSLVREAWGDGKVKKRSAIAYPGNLCIEKVCWPRMTGTVGVPVNWNVEYVTDANGESLILIERTQEASIDERSSYITCRKIYLEENPHFPARIFDPKNLSK